MEPTGKPIRKTAGYILSSYIPIRNAVGADNYRQSFQSCKKIISSVFKRAQAVQPETFEEALQRLSLTEAELDKRYHFFKRSFYMLLMVSLVLFYYAFYVLFTGHFITFLLAFAVTLLAAAQAFKRHFWMFQVRQRRLGCTFREWWQDLMGQVKG